MKTAHLSSENLEEGLKQVSNNMLITRIFHLYPVLDCNAS